MNSITFVQAQAFLQLLQQPGFCIGENGAIYANTVGSSLAPESAAALPAWLGTQYDTYSRWDRKTTLHISVSLYGENCSTTISPLEDGTLFLMEQQVISFGHLQFMQQLSQKLQNSLSALSAASVPLFNFLQKVDHNDLIDHTAAMRRNFSSLRRFVGNMETLNDLSQNKYRFSPFMQDLNSFLQDFRAEVAERCSLPFSCTVSDSYLSLAFDPFLLQHALYNLTLNAIQYGVPNGTAALAVTADAGFVYLQFSNVCTPCQYDRMTNRMISNGIYKTSGRSEIGLSLVQKIAKLHQGYFMLEASQDLRVCATLALSRTMKVPPMVQQNYRLLPGSKVELADILPLSFYHT